MKSLFTLVGVLALGLSAQVSKAADFLTVEDIYALAQVDARNAIEWKVGERAEYSLKMGSFLSGTMIKTVDHNEGNTVWIKQNIDLTIQKQVVDIQMDRADGKILKMLANGQPQTIPDQKIEIVSQDYTEITVPAGAFKCIHVVAKDQDSKKIEV